MRKDELVDVLRHDDRETAPRGKSKAAGASAAPADVLALLKADHENVKALFKAALAKEADAANMQQLAGQIAGELKLHTQAEETIFYPALKDKAIESDSAGAKAEVLEAYVEHDSVKELIAKIEALSAADESYKAVLTVMSEQVAQHVEKEESQMFKQARRLFGKDELASIGEKVAAFKESATRSA